MHLAAERHLSVPGADQRERISSEGYADPAKRKRERPGLANARNGRISASKSDAGRCENDTNAASSKDS
jgi:hypothetical protein